MAVRKIEYVVNANGLEPSTKQFGGVQGDHKATEIVFEISSDLFRKIKAEKELSGGEIRYRFDGYDGQGGRSSTKSKEFEADFEDDLKVEFLLEEWITRYGGSVKVVLVITLLKENQTELELYSFPALIQLKNQPMGSSTGGENFQSMTTIEQIVKEAVEIAQSVRDDADDGIFNGAKGDKGDKGDIGNSGVYVGSGDMPDGYNVQIDPNGDAFEFLVDQAYSPKSEKAQSGIAVADALSGIVSLENMVVLDTYIREKNTENWNRVGAKGYYTDWGDVKNRDDLKVGYIGLLEGYNTTTGSSVLLIVEVAEVDEWKVWTNTINCIQNIKGPKGLKGDKGDNAEVEYQGTKTSWYSKDLVKGRVYYFSVQDSNGATVEIQDSGGSIVTGIDNTELSSMKNGIIMCAKRCSIIGITGKFSLTNLDIFKIDKWDWTSGPYRLVMKHPSGNSNTSSIDIWEI